MISVSSDPPLVHEINSRRSHLAAKLAERVGDDGAVDDRCGSRIVESALFARLLRNTGQRPDVHARLMNYLASADPVHEIERIAQRAIAGSAAPESEANEFLAAFEHATGTRKRAVLATLLALFGVGSLDSDSATSADGTHAIWTDLALCARTVLHDAAQGRVKDSSVHALSDLLGSGPRNQVWQGNVFAHLLGLHALQVVDSQSPLVHEGISAVASVLNPDGGLPFIVGQDVFVSALAGVALHGAGTTTQAARRVGEFLAAMQFENGGWGYHRTTTQSDVDDTSRCVTLLHQIDPHHYAEAIRKGRNYLLQMVGDDGGFPTYVCGEHSEPDLTAGAVIALAPFRPAAGAVGRAVDFLLSQQHETGTWNTSWTISESSVAACALHAWQAYSTEDHARASRTFAAASRTTARLARTQNSDGGWAQLPGGASDVISTAHAVSALARHLPDTAARGVEYLLAAHDMDRPCVPDQVGPRPLPFDFPILADVHVLTAFNQVLRAPGFGS